jgi:RNA polymerase sigma factor (TIGR02999 family)
MQPDAVQRLKGCSKPVRFSDRLLGQSHQNPANEFKAHVKCDNSALISIDYLLPTPHWLYWCLHPRESKQWILVSSGHHTSNQQPATNNRFKMTDVTRILNAIERGDEKATDELLPLVYEELRLLAAQKLSHEQPGQTLQATALVHEAYIRLVGLEKQSWGSKGHFFMAAAEAMRRVLIDYARQKKSLKRGGDLERVPLDSVNAAQNVLPQYDDLIDLDEALEKLSQRDRIKADLVKLRYFAGLTGAQAAQALGISHATADRYWDYASSWLRLEIVRKRQKH